MNTVNLIGRWSKEPEIIQTNSGVDILNTSIAVSDPYDKDNPLFVEVKAFKKVALNTHQYTQKGSKVGVVGKLQLEKWESNGQKRSKHVIIAQNIEFLDEKQKEQPNKWEQSKPAYEPAKSDPGEPIDISDDSLPF